MKCVWIQSTWEAHVSLYVCGACCLDSTFNAPIEVLPLYIGIGIQVLPLLLFHKTLCLLQFPFPYALTNLYFTGIIGDPSTAFTFQTSFFIFCLYHLCFVLFFCFVLFCFFVFLFLFFLLCLLSSFGLESFCFFLRVRTSFASRNHWRSLDSFHFSDEFFHFLFVSPLFCFIFCFFLFFLFFFVFLWLCLLSSIGLESFCFFLRVRTSFSSEVLVMMLQAMCGVFLGLETSH